MNPRKPRRKCKNCGKECHRPQDIYCSGKCQWDFLYNEYIRKWKDGEIKGSKKDGSISGRARRYLLNKYPACISCGWDKKHPLSGKSLLQIHHIDGNRTNNSIKNLQVLCPNCHSLTNNWMNHNRVFPHK